MMTNEIYATSKILFPGLQISSYVLQNYWIWANLISTNIVPLFQNESSMLV